MSQSAQPAQPAQPAPALGRLYLVPTPLDFGCAQQAPITDVLPAASLRQAAQITYWVCENAKSCRAFLKRINEHHPLPLPLQEQHIAELPRHIHKKGDHAGSKAQAGKPVASPAQQLLAPLRQGHDIGLVSEAGMPAIADPGSSLVRAAHDMGAQVVPLVGPVSVLLALAASGLNGQNFAFVGYLPQEASARLQRLRSLENLAHKTGQTQICIETPYRNPALWQALLQGLQPSTRLAVASGLTLASADVQSRSVQAWRRFDWLPDKNTPCVFAWGV
ncbi:MAG: SAM-dependent methyltransferase [Comamonas sp.]|nr:SAM-dependent methyltransferase [Comamonas sp.]